MLPPFIIEQIRKRETEERARHEHQPRLELPIPRPRVPRNSEGVAEEEPSRGVVILEM